MIRSVGSNPALDIAFPKVITDYYDLDPIKLCTVWYICVGVCKCISCVNVIVGVN